MGFSVIHDATPPTLTLEALVQGSDMHVTWSSDDGSSGVDASTCHLEVREDEGAWQTFSTECGGDDTHDGQPGHTYTFRLSASDNVGNADSLEVEAVVPYVTKYYYANGQRVAMWQGDVVYYIHADHLGSTSVLSDGDGQQAGDRVAYLPYGGLRLGDASTLPTDYTFTGQRNEAGIGLMHYGARFYSPRLGRFVSADVIVPGASSGVDDGTAMLGYDEQVRLGPLTVGFHEMAFIGVVGEENREWVEKGPWSLRSEEERQRAKRPWGPEDPQALNRYSYCLGNPLRCVDPTGHQGPHLDAIGWRLEGTVGFIAAIDINFDLVYNLHQQQLELGPNGLKFTPGESDINFSLGVQVLTFGGGATTGPLFVANLPENDRLNEWGWNAGGTVLAAEGVDVNVFGSLSEVDYPEGNPWGVYVGFGKGGEFSAYGGGGYTWNIWDLSKFY